MMGRLWPKRLSTKETRELIKTIDTSATPIILAGRRNGGYVIECGPNHMLLSPAEAAELGAALTELVTQRAYPVTTPAKAQLMRYTNDNESTQ
jgi:hypothetical protein